jgi:hypothetical protein
LIVHGGVFVEEIDHLLPRPMLRVNTRIHHPAYRPPHLILQAAVVARVRRTD